MTLHTCLTGWLVENEELAPVISASQKSEMVHHLRREQPDYFTHRSEENNRSKLARAKIIHTIVKYPGQVVFWRTDSATRAAIMDN